MRQGFVGALAIAFLVVLAFELGSAATSVPGHGLGAALGVESGPAREVGSPLSPHWERPLVPDPSVTNGTTVIAPNGTVSNGSAPLSVSGSVYTVTGSFSGALVDERNDSTLTAGSATVTGLNGSAAVVELYDVHNVSVTHLGVAGSGVGVMVAFAQSVHLTDLTIDPSVATGLWVQSSQAVIVNGTSATGSIGQGASVSDSSGVALDAFNASGRAVGIEVLSSQNVSSWESDLSGCAIGVNATSSTMIDLTGNRISGDTTGVELTDVASVTMSGDVATGGTSALVAEGASSLNVSDESYTGLASPIVLAATFHADLTANVVTGAGEAVLATSSGSIMIVHSNLSGFSTTGIALYDDAGVYLAFNNLSASASGGTVGIQTIDDSGITEFDNTAYGDATGLADVGSENLTLSDNNFVGVGAGGAVIHLQDDGQLTVFQNTLHEAVINGVQVDHAVDGSVTDDFVFGAGAIGFLVDNSTGVSVTHSFVQDAGSTGFAIEDSSGASVWGDTGRLGIGTNGTDLLVQGDTSPLVAFNNLSNAAGAVVVVNCTGGSVIDNNATLSTLGLGILADVGTLVVANGAWHDALAFSVANDSGVSMYHNNFANDSGWLAASGAQSITWDAGYPEGGNYWSNHSGPDVRSGADQQGSGPDGIVDTPVVIGPAGTDSYPLTIPWTSYYAVFTEFGLLVSTTWALEINGARFSAVAPAPILYPEANAPNSTVSWVVLPISGFTLQGVAVGGPWPEQRSNLSYAITFFADRFNATFQEYGLAPGTPWTFVVNGIPEGDTRSAISVSLPNGTYSYLAGAVPGYNLTVGAGQLIVAGPGAVVLIVYVQNARAPAATGVSTTTAELLATALGLTGLVAIVCLALYLQERGRARRPPPPLKDAGKPATSSRNSANDR